MEQPLGFFYSSQVDKCQWGRAKLLLHDSSQFCFGAMDLLSIEVQGKNLVVVHFHTVNKTGDDAAVLMVHRAKDAVIWQDSLDGDEEHGKEVCTEAFVPI